MQLTHANQVADISKRKKAYFQDPGSSRTEKKNTGSRGFARKSAPTANVWNGMAPKKSQMMIPL